MLIVKHVLLAKTF